MWFSDFLNSDTEFKGFFFKAYGTARPVETYKKARLMILVG